MAETTYPPGSDGSTKPALDWTAALAEHQRWLRTIVLARLGELQAADEVMQEVALAAVKQQAPVSDPGKVGAWLYRVAIRQVLLYRRKHGRQRKLLASFSENGSTKVTVDNPLDWLLHDERKALIRKAIAQLSSRDAEILLLKYTEDWSYRELAARLGLSESAVEARLYRARQRLRKAMISANINEVSE